MGHAQALAVPGQLLPLLRRQGQYFVVQRAQPPKGPAPAKGQLAPGSPAAVREMTLDGQVWTAEFSGLEDGSYDLAVL